MYQGPAASRLCRNRPTQTKSLLASAWQRRWPWRAGPRSAPVTSSARVAAPAPERVAAGRRAPPGPVQQRKENKDTDGSGEAPIMIFTMPQPSPPERYAATSGPSRLSLDKKVRIPERKPRLRPVSMPWHNLAMDFRDLPGAREGSLPGRGTGRQGSSRLDTFRSTLGPPALPGGQVRQATLTRDSSPPASVRDLVRCQVKGFE